MQQIYIIVPAYLCACNVIIKQKNRHSIAVRYNNFMQIFCLYVFYLNILIEIIDGFLPPVNDVYI